MNTHTPTHTQTRTHALALAAALSIGSILSLSSAAAHAAGHAHVHGLAKLDVAIDAGKLSLGLESPLDNLVGFERAPRTDAERQAVDKAVAALRDEASMFRIDPAAQCKPAKVDLASAALKLGNPDPAEVAAGHADIDGSFEFDCVDAAKAKWIDVGLFRFERLQKLQVQVATPSGEFRRDLARPVSRLSLVK